MRSEAFSHRLVLDDFARPLAQVLAQEVVVVELPEEADALRVLAGAVGQVEVVGGGAHVGLAHAADREERVAPARGEGRHRA